MKRLAPVAALVLSLLAGIAVGQDYYLVPSHYVSFSGEAVTIAGPAAEDTFVPGLGWLSGSDAPPPLRNGAALLVGALNRQRLGLEDAPPVTAPDSPAQPYAMAALAPAAAARPEASETGAASVRFGGTSEVRVVIDLPHLGDSTILEHLRGKGRIDEGDTLVLDLPPATLPAEQPDPYHGIDVTLLRTPAGTRVELTGPALAYDVFPLGHPTRLVIDVVPLREKYIPERTERLRDGVTYRTFGAPTPTGRSLVHLLEIAPGSGEFRVVGTTEVARTLSELADGAFAAINAGYFDTATFQAIGLLRVDYGLQSLPSRNRASIGFGLAGPVLTRVTASVDVRVAGRVYRRESPANGEGVQVHTVEGARVGSPRQGALVVQQGRVTANRVGPVTVPASGFAVVYPPTDRELALIDPGAPASISLDFEPDAFQSVRWAVEAGPLLLENGRPAFEPEREQFSRGQRILDAYTQQAAIGIRPDGTVLFLVADDMRAEDLVPLFMSLGASDAMRLDSGSSATLFVDGRVLNRDRERRIVSAIVFLPGG